MYSANDIARYIIAYENRASRGISNLRLQKLLYFVQAQFLVSKHEACFDDNMEAWNFGPVVPSVYHNYKIFGSSNIPAGAGCENIKFECTLDRHLIDNILNNCARHSTTELVSLTHNQKPWKEAYSRQYDNKISPQSILSYFGA